MEFRWVALIALWTILIGPVIGPPVGASKVPASHHQTAVKAPMEVHRGPGNQSSASGRFAPDAPRFSSAVITVTARSR
jgi:hypothetical protein